MDETYPDFTLPREAWLVCLTGMLVPADRHREIRARFYKAVADAVGRRPNTVPPQMEIHAAALLPHANDDTRVAFLEKVAGIITEFDLSLYRIGYRRTRILLDMFKTDGAILGIAFGGMLGLMSTELETTPIWPVMETDRSNAQDQAFASVVQFADHVEAHLGPKTLSHDQANLGEVLYSTKRSIHGALVDCAAYLLNVRTRAAHGLVLSDYKRRLGAVADRLTPAIRFDEVITMRHEKPPPGYCRTGGPFRFAVPIIPSDNSNI
jgi:hypothetical protein